MPKYIGGIFARGGSRGVPGKNLRLLAGRSLVGRAVEAARAAGCLSEVFVSTDSEEIASEANKYGAAVPFRRPPSLATDSAPEMLAWRHAVEYYLSLGAVGPKDVLVSVPPTAPLRRPEHIAAVVAECEAGAWAVVVTMTEAYRNPYFNMVTQAPDGSVRIVIQPSEPIHRRQEAPVVYDLATVAYAARVDYILRHEALLVGPVGAVLVDRDSALDIDTEDDLRLAECLLRFREEGDSSAVVP